MKICRIALYRQMDELRFPQLDVKRDILIDMINEGQRSKSILSSVK